MISCLRNIKKISYVISFPYSQCHKILTEVTNQYQKLIQYNLSNQYSMYISAFHRKFEASSIIEVVYVTIRNPVFWLFLCLTGVYFRGKLQHVVTSVSKY